jgi:ribosome biogenesis protein UTP30
MKAQQQEQTDKATKKPLLTNNDDDASSDAEGDNKTLVNEPIWLVLTTKKHLTDKNRLKPGKINLPHSLNTSSSLSICLITADPQRAVKGLIADPTFPTTLSTRITRVIGYTKLRERYKSFESRRQLLAEHGVFLADDRIIMRLVSTLGKTFYKSNKRPIPIRIAEIEKVDGKRVKRDANHKKPKKSSTSKEERHAAFASPLSVAKEIEKTLSCAAVHLAPSTTNAIRVGSAKFTPQQLVENVQAAVNGMAEKFVAKGWRNIKAIHIKGPNTMALPIWLASELWVDEADVLEDNNVKGTKLEDNKKKRKAIADSTDLSKDEIKPKKSKTPKTADDEEELAVAAARKEKLQKQKAKALAASDIPAISSISKSNAGQGKKKKKSIS